MSCILFKNLPTNYSITNIMNLIYMWGIKKEQKDNNKINK